MRIKTFLSALAALAFALLLAPAMAFASHGGPHALAGYTVAAISHGEAAPLVLNHDAIVEQAKAAVLSGKLTEADAAKMAALLTASEQAYGVVKASLMPLNANLKYDWLPAHYPVHATAAYTNEMLLMMRHYGKALPAAAVLADRVDAEMNYMLAPCAYSTMVFDTAQAVTADWGRFGKVTLPYGLALLVGAVTAFNLAQARRVKPLLLQA